MAMSSIEVKAIIVKSVWMNSSLCFVIKMKPKKSMVRIQNSTDNRAKLPLFFLSRSNSVSEMTVALIKRIKFQYAGNCC